MLFKGLGRVRKGCCDRAFTGRRNHTIHSVFEHYTPSKISL